MDGPESASFPERIGRYELLVPIASGGMATVYLARSHGIADFEREVALKLIHRHLRNTEFTNDLVEEAKLAVRIRSPNVVPVLDVGEDPNGTFLVMDYVEGDTLAGLQRAAGRLGGRIPLPIALRILLDSLTGLHAAHELVDAGGRPLGVVHRDYSPQNVLVGVDGIARLTDFGIAKAATRLGHTSTGTVKGKFAYMSPEQARGEPLDRRCDVWAGGVMAWELALQRHLFLADNDATTLLAIVNRAAPRLRSVDSTLPAALDYAVAHALEHDLSSRTQTAAILARELGRVVDEGLEIATAEEVGRYVQGLAGAKLVGRRAAVVEMAELRKRITRIAQSTDTSMPSPLTGRQANGELPLRPMSAALPDEQARTGEATVTAAIVPKSPTRLRNAVMIAALVAAGLGGSVWAWRRIAETRHDASLASAGNEHDAPLGSASSSPPADEPADAETASATPSASASAALPSASASESPSAGPPAAKRPAAPPVPRLGKNPYGKGTK